MLAVSDPNHLIGEIAIGGMVVFLVWRLIVWVRTAPVTPDPWDVATEQKLSEPEAVEICHRCFTEQPDNAWFCKCCGASVGPYNNMMPYVSIFSQSEVLRNGVTDNLRPSPLIIIGYLLFSLSFCAILAPICWFLFFKNLRRIKKLNGAEI